MNNVGTIQATLGGDNGPFIAMFRDAEKVASQGANRIQGKFSDIFKRSPNMRAERAITGLLGGLASGDVIGGITQLAGRITGLGLAAGIGIGGAAIVFTKFKESIDEADAASKKLAFSLGGLENIKGPEAIKAKFAEIVSETDALIEKTNTFTFQAASGLAKVFGTIIEKPSKVGPDADKMIAAGMLAQGTLMEEAAASDAKQLAMKERILQVGEAQAKIEKIKADLAIKQAAIAETQGKFQAKFFLPENVGKISTDERDKLISRSIEAAREQKQTASDEADLEIHNIKAREAADGRKFETAKKLLELERGNPLDQHPPTEVQKKALAAAIDLSSINKGITSPDTSEAERRQLILEKMKQEATLGIMPGTVAPMSGEWWARKQAGESADTEGALRNVGLDQKQIAKYRGDAGAIPGDETGAPAIVAEIQKLAAIVEKWGNP